MELDTWHRLDRLSDHWCVLTESLACLHHMVEVCDGDDAPTPYQLAKLIQALTGYSTEHGQKLYEEVRELYPKKCG